MIVHLEPKRDASLLRRHPWIFRGAIARVEGSAARGDTVDVVNAAGRWMARGAYSPDSQIAVRAWTFEEGEMVDRAFFRRRLEGALEVRRQLGLLRAPPHSPGAGSAVAFRWAHGESDSLPGLVVDVYAGTAVMQCQSAGAERWRETVADLLGELYPLTHIYERSEAEARKKEGLDPRSGALLGGEPPELVEIREDPFRFLVSVSRGHKSGFYLDQRTSRHRVMAASDGRQVLDAFCYTGGFTVAALEGGAESVVQIDASAPALELAGRNLELAGHPPPGAPGSRVESVEGNAFSELRRLRAEERRFDLVVLDPPKLVRSKRQLERAARGYKDLNLLAFQLLRPGGLLFTFSCSGLLAPDLFQKIVADAALDAGRSARLVERLSAPADHPTALAFPEGSYLKGLVCLVD
ncbi:MAG: class I SAM-dependent methyltransferase [Holophagales bacterium]|nr:class I SAM-dependent methyltransferase [Holophagales bacterium]